MKGMLRFLLLVCGIGLVLPGSAYAQLSNGALKGSYGFRFGGTASSTNDVPVSATGVFTADGQGNVVSGTLVYGLNGVFCSVPLLQSNYGIGPDGTGSITFMMKEPVTCPFTQFVLTMTVDQLDASLIAHHVELAAVGSVFSNLITPMGGLSQGEANFQAPRLLITCQNSNICSGNGQ